ncbi:chitinase [Microbotryomycetes sp. JL221]|nr:chitinase [Microbotryomycetes sp. JL221]
MGGIVIATMMTKNKTWYFLFGPGKDQLAGNRNEYSPGADTDLSSDGTSPPQTSGSGSQGSDLAGGSGAAKTASGKNIEASSDFAADSGNGTDAPTATSTTEAATKTGTSDPKNKDTAAVKTEAVIAGFWETWGSVPVADIPWAKYSHVIWFVVTPGDVASKGALDFHASGANNPADFVKRAKEGGSKSLFSIGGWTDSNDFTYLMASAKSRTDFVNTIKAAFDRDSWDGVDLDWEYPSTAGATDDFDEKNDLPNYLAFFKELRKALGPDKIITVDTSSLPWKDPSTGQPSKDLSGFVEYIDLFNVMTYDAFRGAISGPNFPYSGDCSPQGQTYNYKDAMKAWTDAKVPAEKLVLGMAAYGHSWTVDKFDETGAAAGAKSPVFQNGVSKEGLQFTKIVENGLLDGAKLDECTQTMYHYKDKVMTVFDNGESTKAKGKLAKAAKWAGCMVFALDNDHDNEIVNAMRESC